MAPSSRGRGPEGPEVADGSGGIALVAVCCTL